MRIAIFTNNYLPNPYGVAGSIESFRKGLEKQGHVVYIFAPHFKNYVDGNPNVFRYPALDLTFKNVHFPIAIPFSFRMNKILKKLEIDVVHSQHPNLLGWEARRWAKKKNVPLVFTWHTLYDQYAHFAPLIPSKLAAWWTIGNAVRYADKADQVITPTNSVREIIRKWGVRNANILSIPTGVEEEKFTGAERENTRSVLGIAPDETALVLVSRLTAEKNVLFLARVVAKVLRESAKTKFILAGDGSELIVMKRIFAEAGVEHEVIYQGIVSGEQKKNIYAAGDIFVYASKSETQGMVVSEAMYGGLPVVAVRATGIIDLVANQISGLLVEEDETKFAAAILKLVDGKELHKTFSQNAARIARENYTAAACARKLAEAYGAVIKRKL